MLTDKQAAEYLGITVEELWLTKNKGMPPGNLAIKVDGQYFWEKNFGLTQHGRKDDSEYIEHICIFCGFQAKSEAGLKTHQRHNIDNVSHQVLTESHQTAEDAFSGFLSVDEVRDSEEEE